MTDRFAQNIARLSAAQKPSYGTAAYGRFVNRPAGRIVAAAAHTVGVSPDTATAISACLSAAGLLLLGFAEPTPLMGLGVAVLLAAGYVMDSVDGQLARLRGGGSPRGEWLDHMVDAFKTSSLHIVVAVSWYRFPPTSDRGWILVPLGFAVVQSVTYFGLMLIPFLRGKNDLPTMRIQGEHPLRKWLILPTDYGFLCWTFVLIASGRYFAIVYTSLFVLSAIMLALALRKWWRELS